MKRASAACWVSLLLVGLFACGGDSGGDGDGDGDGDVTQVIEAEDFDTTVGDGLVDWIEVTDSFASGAKAMVVLNGLATTCTPEPAEVATTCRPQMTFNVDIPSDATIFMHVIGKPQELEAGSVWTFVDDGAGSLSAWEETRGGYDYPMNAAIGTPLTAGPHVFTVAVSEDGTTLDRIVITSSPTPPDLD